MTPATLDELAAQVDAIRADPARRDELTGLLDERHPIYQQRGAIQVAQLRGWILHAFEQVGLPDAALPYALEELESGHDAYLVAAAASALRGRAAPTIELAAFLVRAIANITGRDDRVSFERLGAHARPGQGTTALAEIFTTLAWLGPLAAAALPALRELRAAGRRELSAAALAQLDDAIAAIEAAGPAETDCCGLPTGAGGTHAIAAAARADAAGLAEVELEDHDGRRVRYGDFFAGKPAIVAFFYTRCANPRKCSLTIARLARLQRQLAAAGLAHRVRTAAISYDPGYDGPERLRTFGAARGVRLDEDHRMLRAPRGFDALRAAFGLGVGFLGSLVNRHRIELYVLDARGRVAGAFVRLDWRDDDVLARVREVLDERPPSSVRAAGAAMSRAALAVGPPLAIALFPKCPLCWAAYLGAFGVAGLDRIPYAPWLIPVFIALMAVNVAIAWRRARARGGMAAFVASIAGALVVLVLGLGLGVRHAMSVGIVLSFAGAVLGSVTGTRTRSSTVGRAFARAP